jgi:hypothetical protein
MVNTPMQCMQATVIAPDLVGLEMSLLRQLTGVRAKSRDGVLEAAHRRFGKTALFRLSYGYEGTPMPQQSFHRLFDNPPRTLPLD